MNPENTYQNLEIATEEQKEKIRDIESLNIRPGSKAELILVILGVKPATNVGIKRKHDSPETVRQKLVNCGLFVKEMNRPYTPGAIPEEHRVMEFAVSKDEDTANRLTQLSPNKGKEGEEFGFLMGFPESAVHAFSGAKGKLLQHKQYPPTDDLVFRFMLSEDGWEKEYAQLKYWSELIKKYSPQTYSEIVKKK